MTNFWESSVWAVMIQLLILLLFLLIGELLRKKVPFIKNSLLPTSVIGGLLLLIIKELWPWLDNLIDTNFMSVLTYHMLALGFIATSLKLDEKKTKSETKTVFCTGIVTVSGYILQGILGLIVTIPLSYAIKELIPAAGLLLPMGFGQGTGQALNWGATYENTYGFENGTTFGLSIAALGFIVACVVGVIYLSYLKKKGLIKETTEINSTKAVIRDEDEVQSTEAIDKLTIQLMLIALSYLLTYLLMLGLSNLVTGTSLEGTAKPLIWGFNFLFGTVIAIFVKNSIKFLRKHKLLKGKQTNTYLLKRLSGFFFDLMIVGGIAAIDVEKIEKLWIPLALMGILGTIGTFIYLKIMAPKLWKGYENEGILSMFGMLTGTASTGMILLREIDEDYQTPAADNLVYQQVAAIAFGFPVLILLSIAPKSTAKLYISLAILVAMFVVYNLIIYFTKKKKK